MQIYSNPKRANDPHALPDVEVFEIWGATPYVECPQCDDDKPDHDIHKTDHCGWYWWSCFPGCLPDSDPIGPFDTETEAVADAQNGMEDDES